MGTQIFDSQIKDNIALTGAPTAPTPSVSDDSTRIATTEFVHTTLTAKILGTVSQVGGVPTGAIIESGNNANGEYVKFADGTMMTYRSTDLTFTGTVITSGAEDIAALYKDMNYIVSATPRSTITGSGAYCAVFKANPYTEGSVTVEAADLQNMARTGIVTVNITTIGWWF